MLSYFLDSFCSLIDSFNIYVVYVISFIFSIIFIVLCVWLHRQEVLMWLFNFFIYIITFIIFVYIMLASIFGRN